jgi:hypothetical protein
MTQLVTSQRHGPSWIVACILTPKKLPKENMQNLPRIQKKTCGILTADSFPGPAPRSHARFLSDLSGQINQSINQSIVHLPENIVHLPENQKKTCGISGKPEVIPTLLLETLDFVCANECNTMMMCAYTTQ